MIQNIMQRMIYVALVLAAAMLVSCQQGELLEPSSPVRDGYVLLRFNTDIPAMEKVPTRSVDPDGGGVQDMTLFCFDKYSLFITAVAADINANHGVNDGSFTAQVPENTRKVHFVANQVMTNFPQDYFRNKSESEVMALLEGSSGRMIYWARFSCNRDDDRNIAEQMSEAGNSITMLRNHAKISVKDPELNAHFNVTGFAVYNTNAFGTVAPYHPEKGFSFNAEDWKNDNFVTLPANEAKLSDVTEVSLSMGRYVFECENTVEDPVSVILKGYNKDDAQAEELYYRVMLMQNGEQIPVRRNHDYQINITGSLSFGQKTFAEALDAAATNNVWISISDKVNEVEDNDYILTVAQTDYVLGAENAGHPYMLTYTVTGKNGKQITDADKADITWIDNLVAQHNVSHEFKAEGNVGHGTVTISLLPLGNNEKLEGTLLVKKGHLQRKIKVIIVKEQSFAPSWVGTEIYGVVDQTDPKKDRSHVTVMFTVPETVPAELFPLNVYISVPGLDIRPESGMSLTVVRDGEKDWYSSGNITPEPDYKYLYTVEQPGVQRVYFENILNQKDDYVGRLYIEAEHFNLMSRTFTYSQSRQSITIEGLLPFRDVELPGAAEDEYILYRLIPQKINANVQLTLQLREKVNDGIDGDMQGEPFNAGEKDEFMFYSRYLDFYSKDEVGSVGEERFDCLFYPDESDSWWRRINPDGGRMMMFKPRKEIVSNPPDGTGRYSIYLKSNSPKSAEVIRVAANRKGTDAVLPEDALADGKYAGNTYRSVTFELSNYNPFRFGARLQYGSDDAPWDGKEPDRVTIPYADVQELITPLEWEYGPGENVNIAFDITSFQGYDGSSVDPFGTGFDIYIDAPMLELGTNPGLGDDKFREVSPGRFVYTVDADRENERKYFPGTEVINKDAVAKDQSGERKCLNFKVKSSVSAGDIVISSDNSKVVFYTKTFRVTNSSKTGKIQYQQGGSVTDVDKNAFIAFEKVNDGSRIGAVTVTDTGSYELRLRKEYSFNWFTDKVQFRYSKGGVIYSKVYDSLSDLFESQDAVVLTVE